MNIQIFGEMSQTKCCGVFRTMSTAQKLKFSIKDFFSKCDRIRGTLTSNILRK